MPCPVCASHLLWDDMLWWGCHDCGWIGQQPNVGDTAKDIFVTHDEAASLRKKALKKELGKDV